MTVYEFIEAHEGRKDEPYKCSAGHWTIGVGWNMDANPLPPYIEYYLKQNGRITNAMADHLLVISVRSAIADCRVLFPNFDEFTNSRRMALIDFVFQLGFKRARTFVRAIAAVNTGRWEDAAAEMRDSAWAHQTPNRAAEVTDMIEAG